MRLIHTIAEKSISDNKRKKKMKTSHDNLDKLKEKNPFTVPEGYLEGLTQRLMEQIPDTVQENEPQEVTGWMRIRPFFYMAGMFAGLVLFFKLFFTMPDPNGGKELSTDSLLVQTGSVTDYPSFYTTTEEDQEYLDYVEEQYSAYLLEEEIGF